MTKLLRKDLQILKRSPLLVAMLVIYPILLAALVGFAVTSGPSKPRVALVNEVDTSKNMKVDPTKMPGQETVRLKYEMRF